MSGSGFPNAAEEAGTEPLNLHKLVVKRPASTFFMRVEGDLHEGIGIYSGDVLVIDRSLSVQSGDLVVAYVSGDFLLRQYRGGEKPYLMGSGGQEVIGFEEGTELFVWGVVSHAVHDYRKDIML